MRIKQTRNGISPSLLRKQRRLAKVPQQAHSFFVKATPIRSGNARRKTSLKGNVIDANYPYAQRLDDGWSRQAPRGMVKPTLAYIKRLVKSIILGR